MSMGFNDNSSAMLFCGHSLARQFVFLIFFWCSIFQFRYLPARFDGEQLLLLNFTVCGGLANQRVALVSGFWIAEFFNVVAVLPNLFLNGTQDASNSYSQKGDHTLFSEIYRTDTLKTNFVYQQDVKELISGTAKEDILIIDISLPVLKWLRHKAAYGQRLLRNHIKEHGKGETVPFVVLTISECPFGMITFSTQTEVEKFWEKDKELQSSNEIQEIAQALRMKLEQQGSYTCLHPRLERDWELHCAKWSKYGWNCSRNKEHLANTLTLENISRSDTLYIASEDSVADLFVKHSDIIKDLIHRHKKITTKQNLLRSVSHYSLNATSSVFSREGMAAVDFILCDGSNTFVGNSVSTFSALLLGRRLREGKRSLWYNGGSIPFLGIAQYGKRCSCCRMIHLSVYRPFFAFHNLFFLTQLFIRPITTIFLILILLQLSRNTITEALNEGGLCDIDSKGHFT